MNIEAHKVQAEDIIVDPQSFAFFVRSVQVRRTRVDITVETGETFTFKPGETVHVEDTQLAGLH